MEIRLLKYFLTVAQEEGINRAAEVLHITQPTLSRQLSQLEKEMGVKLFIRGSKKITLTNEGVLLRRRAMEILSLVDKTEHEIGKQDKLVEGKIVIGGGELAAMQVLSEIIDGFHQKYPHVTFDLITANADSIKEQMEKGLIDIGLLLEPIDIEKFEFIRLKEKENWVVIMRPDDVLADKNTISAKDLKNAKLILPRRSNVQNELSNWLGSSFKKDHILFTSNLSTNAALMVQRGLGYSIVIEGSIPFLDKEKIIYKPLDPSISATSVISWKRQQPFGLATTKFIDYIKCFSGIE